MSATTINGSADSQTRAPQARPMTEPGVWHIVITRTGYVESLDALAGPDLPDIVIGPFATGDEAEAHLESVDVEDWHTAEAKAARYVVHDAYTTDDAVEIPPYGINPPVPDDPEDDARTCHCGAPATPGDYPDVCGAWPICETPR